MSQLTIEHTIGQVGTSHSMVFHLPNTHSGIYAIAIRIYRYFIFHNPLDVLATNRANFNLCSTLSTFIAHQSVLLVLGRGVTLRAPVCPELAS